MLCLHVFLGTFCLNPHFLNTVNVSIIFFYCGFFSIIISSVQLVLWSNHSLLLFFTEYFVFILYSLSVRIFVDVFHFLVCLLILLYIYLPHTTYIFSTIGRPNSSTSMNLSDYVGCNLIMVYNIKNKQHSFLYVYILFQLGKSFQTMLW